MKPVFPAIYSTLCPIALSSLVSEKYEIRNVQCKFLVRGVGDTYLVESSEDRFILRVYRSSHRSLPHIKEEVELLLALKLVDVSVSYPIPDISGQVIQKLEAVEGERHAVLFSYAPGHTVRVLNENQLRVFGREMARFHNVSSAIKLGEERWNFDLETTLFSPLKMLKPAFAEDPEGYAWLQHTAKQVEEKLSVLNTSGFSKGYCHFDFLPKNFHFEGDSVTFFDFDFMGYGWLVNDIMSFWQHLTLDVYTGRMTQKAANDAYTIFLDGYRECRSVSEQELAVVPYLSLGFWLFYMGFHTTHDQFYAFIQPSHLKVITGLLRHMVETYWNTHLSGIGQ
ncbi:Ser/Thr protein kinase RdoA involved in Cpx stress response, MazF antagonist [Chitinophaga sp. CF118]|uniref:phosphotransferase enzyme family protein n=1 Tax=Chitinophaga sp. CF118 TaxID=1884367 RepID=UPI0008F32520|nr:phosphotransferase [Chitinophaga sp. CF118]SFD89165.1 Ser/Thr protein kinase RdoA involved in Cpx stress response, MazF antagonist [Chitinophaga sp. CF118]